MELPDSLDYPGSLVYEDLKEASKLTGPGCPLLTTLPQFVTLLTKSGLPGPNHLTGLCLERKGRILGRGTQFTVFEDKSNIMDKVVMKRVNAELIDSEINSMALDDRRKSHLRTLELEILALSIKPIRDHANIVKVTSWGFDYPLRDTRMGLPVLFMEKAVCSLTDVLKSPSSYIEHQITSGVKYQLSSDVLAGLVCLHNSGIVHGDLKPENILIFETSHHTVPLVAKLSDFGMCFVLEGQQHMAYSSCRGTSGWLAPEILDAEPGNQEPSDQKLLTKCDVFSFGLLMLSIFITSGEAPFSRQKSITKSYKWKALQLIQPSQSRVLLPASILELLQRIITATLDMEPTERVTLDENLLADGSPEHVAWSTLHETRLLPGGRRSKSRFAELEASTPTIRSFSATLNQVLLADLDKHIGSRFDPVHQKTIPGTVLLEMAMSTSNYRPTGFQVKYTSLVRYAAHASCSAAQGIAGRLLQAQHEASTEHESTKLRWLETAAGNGCLIAAEDLAKVNVAQFLASRKAFRKKGGYNKGTARTEVIEMIVEDTPYRTVQTVYQLCDSLQMVDQILDAGGNTLLHYAATYGKAEFVSHLVKERQASINIRNYVGETPLYKACLSASLAAVRVLTASGADATIPAEPFKITCLHWLFNFDSNDMEQAAELLIGQGEADVNARTITENDGKVPRHIPAEHFPFHWPFGTPLHWAIAARSKSAASTLLNSHADINALDFNDSKDGQSALAMAMYRADADMVEYIVHSGASLGEHDLQGRNILHLLVTDYSELNRAVRLPKCIWSWVVNGGSHNQICKVQRCLAVAQELGVSIDTPRIRSCTALTDAIDSEDACSILVLLKAGADADHTRPARGTILQQWIGIDARKLTYPELYFPVLELLLEKTTDVNKPDETYGESTFHYAVGSLGSQEQFKNTIHLLLARTPPSDINAKDRDGITPLMKILGSWDMKNIAARTETLIHLNVDLRLRDNQGRDWAWILCENIHISDRESEEILISVLGHASSWRSLWPSLIAPSGIHGATPLMDAVRRGKFRCMKILVNLCVNINAVSYYSRRTALDWALDAANSIRQSFLDKVIDGFSPTDRQGAIDDRSAFSSNMLLSGIGNLAGHVRGNPQTLPFDDIEVLTLIEDGYFQAPKIIEFLEAQGAKRAKDLIENPDMIPNPFLADMDNVFNSEGHFTAVKQPFVEQWTRLYELAWDEHKGQCSFKCICCELLKEIRPEIRDLPFSLDILEEVSKHQPTATQVEGLYEQGFIEHPSMPMNARAHRRLESNDGRTWKVFRINPIEPPKDANPAR